MTAVNGTRIMVTKGSLDGIFKSKNTAEGINGEKSTIWD